MAAGTVGHSRPRPAGVGVVGGTEGSGGLDGCGDLLGEGMVGAGLEAEAGECGLEEGVFSVHAGEEGGDGCLAGRAGVVAPVVCGFGDDGDYVFDLFLQAVGGASGEEEDCAFAAGGDIFHGDGAGEPAGHGLRGTVYADPSGDAGGFGIEGCGEVDAAADLVGYLTIAAGTRLDIGGGAG